MAILRLVAEHLGPFRQIDIDFSDGNGNPHLGPHIFAGVNGSGKSSVLNSIAWALADKSEFLGRERIIEKLFRNESVVGLIYRAFGSHDDKALLACSSHFVRLQTEKLLPSLFSDVLSRRSHFPPSWKLGEIERCPSRHPSSSQYRPKEFVSCAYGPAIRLQHLNRAEFQSAQDQFFDSLAFESAVTNEVVQAWITNIFSKNAFSLAQGEENQVYRSMIGALNRLLSELFGQPCTLAIDIEKLEPRLEVFGQRLTLSQLPQGIASVLGWFVDFSMRKFERNPRRQDPTKGPGVLILDEVDAYLHPKWQRRILPALRAGLPDVQIIVTSHSPYVISSCPGARIHLLDLNESSGEACYKGAMDSPIGNSVSAVLHDILGVSERFDMETEKQLKEWQALARKAERTQKEEEDLEILRERLSGRSEELSLIVGPQMTDNLAATLQDFLREAAANS